jgi:anion-transporting  ArsA/GET3 family ATPase
LLSNVFDFVANAAPGVREIVTVGKFAYEVRENHYDLVVVDATSTGHVIGQLDAPSAINQLVGSGLIQNQTGWMREILQDPTRTGVVAVTTPEEMPIVETLELLQKVRALSIHVAAVVVNRVREERLTKPDWELLERAVGPTGTDLDSVVGGKLAPLLRSARFVANQRREREPHLASLLGELCTMGAPPITGFIPWLANAVPGPAMTTEVAELLDDEFGLSGTAS